MKCQALCWLIEIETQIGHSPYTQDPQGLLGDIEIEANNSNTMQNDSYDNIYVPSTICTK